MDKQRKEHRDRLVTLSFVSVLLILMYGPAASWFIAADRFVYDMLAGTVSNPPLEDSVIVSVNPAKKSRKNIVDELGLVTQVVRAQNPARIIMPSIPAIGDHEELPGWAAMLASGPPVFVPHDHRFAGIASHTGVFVLLADGDDVLRRSTLWHLQGGVMEPSLPLAVALQNPEYVADPRVSSTDSTIFFSNYEALDRIVADDVLKQRVDLASFTGKTVFIDADPSLVGAVATLPSGQFVTASEITASLLANVEQHRAIIAPTWVRALEWLIPAMLGVVAVLFLPGRPRREIMIIAIAAVIGLLLIEFLFLTFLRVKLDLGRPMFIFFGGALLSWWLGGTDRKASQHALKRGSDFLSAGRLEPAFAEFRRCEPSETLANVMYKTVTRI